MIGQVFAGLPGWPRDAAIAGLLILGLAVYFVKATRTRQGERKRRVRLGILAFVGSPLLAACLAGASQACTKISRLDLADHYTRIIGVGVIVGLIVGLFFLSNSLLSSNDPRVPEGN